MPPEPADPAAASAAGVAAAVAAAAPPSQSPKMPDPSSSGGQPPGPAAPVKPVGTGPGGVAQPAYAAHRYAWVLLTGILGYLAISAGLLSAYVLTEGRGFFIPMKWPTWSFIQLFAAPTFLAAFVPFVGVHMIATALRLHITPRSAALAGGAMGAMAGWAICGRQGCFGPFGTFPLLGWYIAVSCLFSALFYQLNARKHGF